MAEPAILDVDLLAFERGDGAARAAVVDGVRPGLIQSPSQASLPGLSAWVEVGGIAPSLCLKAPPPQPIST